MTPVLFGRWQTRFFMLATLGALVTLVFALSYKGFNDTFFFVLFAVFYLGLAWDIVWILLQRLRWDRDWPAAFQLGSGIVEGALVYSLTELTGLPGVDKGTVPLDIFCAHYGTTWLVTFAFTQGPMRVVFPRWRFAGGRVV